jgi:hypothetical protein
MVIFNSYVKLPEGIYYSPDKMGLNDMLNGILRSAKW